MFSLKGSIEKVTVCNIEKDDTLFKMTTTCLVKSQICKTLNEIMGIKYRFFFFWFFSFQFTSMRFQGERKNNISI